MSLPDFEPRRIPDGEYIFTITELIERRKHTDKNGKPYESVKFGLEAVDEDGTSYTCQLSFLNFSQEYQKLLMVLGAGKNDRGNLSGKTIDPVGSEFRGEIYQRPDNKDKDKTWTDIRNVQSVDADWPKKPGGEEQEGAPAEDDDSIPF